MQFINEQTIEIISTNRYGVLAKDICLNPFFSPDGKKVAFYTKAIKFDSNQTDSKEYELIVKDIYSNHIYLPNTDVNNNIGNGVCPLLKNEDLNKNIYSAKFSPDSNKILFLSKSTNLISGEFTILPNNNEVRWYVKNLNNGNIHRLAFNGVDYGNSTDDFEALWLDDDRIIFTSYSNNLVVETDTDSQDIYMANISTNTIELLSRYENGNPNPYISFGCYNLAISPIRISFYSSLLGYCIKNLNTSELIRVEDLSALSNNSITNAEFFDFDLYGDRALFRLTTDELPNDTNASTDDFIYNFIDDSIEYINETDTYDFGDSTSKNSKFSPNGSKVAFLSNSSNLDPNSTNDKFNLYVKDLSNNEITRVSKSNINGNINSDIIDYCWLSEHEICYTTSSTNIEIPINNSEINWYYKNLVDNQIISINTYMSDTQFAIYNNYDDIRRDLFDYDLKKILFITNPETLNYAVNSQGYNIPNVFSKTFQHVEIEYPSEPIFSHPSNSVNATVTSLDSTYTYTGLDNITNLPTLSIISSTYTERVDSIQHRNDISSSVRWMSFCYPELPDSLPLSSAKLGMGIFKATPNLDIDLLSVKKDNIPNIINPVIGILTTFEVKPKNDVVILNAGVNQTIICIPITVYLEASIRGNQSGHTFLWEQIQGTPQIITQTTNTMAYFIRNSTGSDLIFRYWIDKGKPNEQFEDVTIYGTPSSLYTDSVISLANQNPITHPDYAYIQNTLEYTTEFDINIPFNSNGKIYNLTTDYIMWKLPIFFYNFYSINQYVYNAAFESTVLQIYNNSTKQWETTKISSLTEDRIANGVSSLIRLGVTYKENNSPKYTLYSPPFYVNENNLIGNTVLTKTKNSINDIFTTLNKRIFEVLTFVYELDLTLLKNSIQDIYNNTVRRVFTVEFLEYEDDINKNISSVNDIKLTIIRLNGGNIGG